jgi:hypothetical protein
MKIIWTTVVACSLVFFTSPGVARADAGDDALKCQNDYAACLTKASNDLSRCQWQCLIWLIGYPVCAVGCELTYWNTVSDCDAALQDCLDKVGHHE